MTVLGNCRSTGLLRPIMAEGKSSENTKVPRKLQSARLWVLLQLLAQRSSTVWQDCKSPETTGSKNMYYPARATTLRNYDLLADSRLGHEWIPGVFLLRYTVWVHGAVAVIWRAMLKWSIPQAAIFKITERKRRQKKMWCRNNKNL